MALDRNGLEVISADDCWRLLAANHIGRLAVCLAGRCEIFPVNYVVDDGGAGSPSIVFLSASGTKLAGVVLGTTVAFEIDAADPLFHTGWSVVAHGVGAEIETTEELQRAEELPLKPWGPPGRRSFVRLSISQISGRRILPAGNR